MYHLECIECGKSFPASEIIHTCSECNGLLEVAYDLDKISVDFVDSTLPQSVWKYRVLLPFPADFKPVTIQEGGTPLYKLDTLAKTIGATNVYVKHEGLNPTGSFKDRGMTVGVSKAVELGMTTVACASTGNTSASLAIYGAKAQIPAVVLLPEGKVALGKVAQALMHGAKVLSVRGNFDEALILVRQLCDSEGFYLLNSINPFRLEGQKTIAFEVAESLGWKAPDVLVLPVGNAGNISAIYKGFKELKALGIIDSIPRMCGIQAEGAAPIVKAFKGHENNIHPESHPETIATAIRIGEPVNAAKALRAIYESGGTAISVTDDQIVDAQIKLARLEGIGVEPASATSVAGLIKLIESGTIKPDEVTVCITTGHLLKDPEEVIKMCEPPVVVDATVEAINKAVFG